MAVIVIGGHTRNIGKTSVVAGLISAMPEMRWTAIKITQHDHGVGSANGEQCDCGTADHTVAISEEHDRTSRTDSSRYLAAGAAKSLWVRTRQGQLAQAMPLVRAEIARAENVIVESNSILRFLRPDVYASVLDPAVADFKASSLRYLDRADALLLTSELHGPTEWRGVSMKLLEGIRRFEIHPPAYCSAEFVDFVAQRMEESSVQFAASVVASK